ncbi:MAG: hypothetical protein N3A64_00230 [Desulfobacterota bacterium]|nr:hypothetical protein [Thermodesulfobacteriota bacterium]
MRKIFFLAAIEEEFNFLKPRLIDFDKIQWEFIPLGIGIIDPIINLGKNYKILNGGKIIFLGTAGIIGKRFVPGETYQGSYFRWVSTGLTLKKGFLPGLIYPDIGARKLTRGLSEAIIISPPEITADDAIAEILEKENGFCLENLEAYAVAKWFKAQDKSITAILSVSNQVGKESHSQYLKYRELAWEKLAKAIQKILFSGEIKEKGKVKDG